MLVPRFEMHVAESVDDALLMRAKFGDDSCFYCGGTELLLVMKLGLTDLAHLIDLKQVEELRTISIDESGLRIGAAVTYRQLEQNPLLKTEYPEFVEMICNVANVRVRTSGSLGGNLAFADPSSDPATFLLAVGGQLEIGSIGGCRRVVAIDGFYNGPYQPDLKENEMIVSIRIPRDPDRGAIVHQRMKLKERPNITVAAYAAASLGRISKMKIAIGSISLVPVSFDEVNQTLIGTTSATLAKQATLAGKLASDSISLFEDSNGSLDYKKQLVCHFVELVATRTIGIALSRNEQS